MGFGAVGLIGNWVAGRAAERWPIVGTAAAVLAVGLTVGALSLVGGPSDLLLPLLAIWGMAHGAGFVLCQIRVLRAGSEAPAFAMSLNIAACNFGIAIGAQAGGAVIETAGLGRIGLGAVCFTLLALGQEPTGGRPEPRRAPAPTLPENDDAPRPFTPPPDWVWGRSTAARKRDVRAPPRQGRPLEHGV
jgi:hypothetical protein